MAREAPRTLRLLVVGFGPVGRQLVRLAADGRDEIARRYGLHLEVAGIATSRATWVRGPGNGLADLLSAVDDGAPLLSLPGVSAGWDGAQAIASIPADVLIEATPTALGDGEPAATHIRLALEHGMHVVSASKGALIHRHAELRALARPRGLQIRIGAATAAALPTVDFADFCLAGARVERVDGILNGTSNFVLSRMQSEGMAFEAALQAAQAQGMAEADPTLDVDGWDTAGKLVLIAGALWEAGLRLDDVAVEGIRGIEAGTVEAARRTGNRIRLIGSLWWEAGLVRAAVRPRSLGPDDPLAHVDGAEKGATFHTDTMHRVTVVGGRSSPTGAAAALLRDLINLGRA